MKKLLLILPILCIGSLSLAMESHTKQNLVFEAMGQNLEACREALQKGAIIDHLESIPVNNADGYVNIVQVSPLIIAVANKDFEMVSLFIEHKADINLVTDIGGTALHETMHTIKTSDDDVLIKIASLLMSKGANIYAPDEDGTTPLDLLKDKGLEDLKDTLT